MAYGSADTDASPYRERVDMVGDWLLARIEETHVFALGGGGPGECLWARQWLEWLGWLGVTVCLLLS